MANTPINIPSFEEAARIEQFVNFSKNSYLVNNNALYNKHTEHISTTEPIFIDGMAGSDNVVHERGGDAAQNTYWAYEYESGKFLLGKFNEDDIKVKCETDSSNLWIVDAEGVYIEQDALDSYMESDCLDAINAKYGTNFSTLTMQKVTSVAIGDDCPDWDAYEKITIQGYFAVSFGYNVFGYLKEGVYEMARYADGKAYTADNNGVILSQTVVAPGGQGYDDFVQAVKDRFLQNNIIVNEIVGKIETYAVGDTIANWNEYTKL